MCTFRRTTPYFHEQEVTSHRRSHTRATSASTTILKLREPDDHHHQRALHTALTHAANQWTLPEVAAP